MVKGELLCGGRSKLLTSCSLDISSENVFEGQTRLQRSTREIHGFKGFREA